MPINVLVVDDSVVIRRLVSTVLEEDPDIRVAGTAANGRLALAKLPSVAPDLITLDIEMPELDGLGLARAARDGGLWQGTPLVALTSHTDDAAVRRSREAGFDRHVPKFDRDALLDALRGCMSVAQQSGPQH